MQFQTRSNPRYRKRDAYRVPLLTIKIRLSIE